MFSLADTANGIFEFGGACLMWTNVPKLLRDKQIRGINWQVTTFFALWGWWNLYYYPSLHQWLSTIGGAVMVFANTTWVVIAIKYRKN